MKISLRELLLVITIVAMALAWTADHSRLSRALAESDELQRNTSSELAEVQEELSGLMEVHSRLLTKMRTRNVPLEIEDVFTSKIRCRFNPLRNSATSTSRRQSSN